MHVISATVVLALAGTCVSGYPNLWNNLTPVHGLYVKPSADGITGDLYVAATEDKGVKSQWAVDQPINYLPVSTAQPHATAVQMVYPSSYSTSHDDSATKKRAIAPSPSPPVQYAYALPIPSGTPSENTPVAAYPYAYQLPASSATATTESSAPKCEHPNTVPHYPYQFPYNLFYPQVMTAYTNAMSILKDAGLSEDTASSVMAQASPMWPPSSYAYPMYVMVDPNAWNQNQAATTSPTPASSSTAPSEENTEA